MTFCAECKQELIERCRLEGCCNAAHLYGLVCFAKTFSRKEIVFTSDNPQIIDHIRAVLAEFGIYENAYRVKQLKRDTVLTIFDRGTVDRLFIDFGYADDEFSIGIKDCNFMCDGCIGAFITGCFLSGGTITTPKSGYHLEFSSHRTKLFNEFAEVIRRAGFAPKVTMRTYTNVLYFKNSTQIEDLLAYMGAMNASFELMNAKIYKEIVNSVNRRTNCESANIDKIVSSAANDGKDIELIFSTMGEHYLPEDLNEIARLRLKHPELSLTELGEKLEPKLSKSGVNHRLRKIRAEAARLKEQNHANEAR